MKLLKNGDKIEELTKLQECLDNLEFFVRSFNETGACEYKMIEDW